MAIDPTKSGGIPAYTPPTVGTSRPAVRDARNDGDGDDAAAARTVGDQVQLSSASRGLVESAQAPAPVEGASAAGLSADRLKTVLERLQSGFYDRADVRHATARGIQKDLGTE